MRTTTLSLITILILAGLSVAYTGFSDASEGFSINVQDDELTITVTDDAIYNQGWYSLAGDEWIAFNFTQASTGGWIINGEASKTLNNDWGEENYIIIYSCSRGTTWNCHGGQWQIIAFNTSIEEETPSSGWQEGLLHWWSFDEDAADSVGGNDGQTNSVTQTTTGCINDHCYSFDSNQDYITLSSPISLTSGTYSFWLTREDTSDDRLIMGDDPYHSRIYLSINGNIRVETDLNAEEFALIGTPIPQSKTTHILLTRDEDTMRLYINGVYDRSATITGASPMTLSQIGMAGRSFRGTIDEAMIWNRPLSATEAAQVYAFFDEAPCTSHAQITCSDGSVYWFDSCGIREELKEMCNSTQTCIGGICSDNGQIAWKQPNMYLNAEEIAAIKERLNAGEEPWQSAYDSLIASADAELAKSYYSVTKNGGSRGTHAYLSEGPYYWPCNDNPCDKDCSDGSTVVCDGQYNPDADREDYLEAIRVGKATRNLALAYTFTGDERYADKAVYFIKHWTTDSETMMEPAYTDFQSQIELSITIPGMLYGADLLLSYNGWTAGDKEEFLAWAAAFGESAQTWSATNNFENWRNVVLFSVAAVTLDDQLLEAAVSNWQAIIPSQISTVGFMSKETGRTNSLSYSTYALNAMIQGAEIARHHGINLYSYTDSRGIGLKTALDNHAPYVTNPSSWPYEQIAAYTGDNAALYELAYLWNEQQSYLSAIDKWGRPLSETRIMGPVTLTHASGAYSPVITD